MTKTIGIVLFDDAEELDFVGPFEVFTMSSQVQAQMGQPVTHKVLLIGPSLEPVRCAKGMRVLPDVTMDDAPELDVILIPGGMGTRREVTNTAHLAWIEKASASCRWITSVCTGAMLLTASGLARGKQVTTHWAFIETLRARKEAAEVLEGVRYVRDGNIVTSAGVSAGIDMALWLIGQIHDPVHARAVQRAMEYDPAPPYAAQT